MRNHFGIKTAQSREDGYKIGVPRYWGNPCKHGHHGVRFVSTGSCVSCIADKRSAMAKAKCNAPDRKVDIDHLKEKLAFEREFGSEGM